MIFTVELFGPLRRHSPVNPIEVDAPVPIALSDLRAHIADALNAYDPAFDREDIFRVSALATEAAILPRDAVLSEATRLALIAPVSGG
jgi:molybdopterin converting factor small subunit